MAGQPPDPSFPPPEPEPDQGLTRGRPAWPGYDVPAAGGGGASAGDGGAQAYAAPPPGRAQDHGYGSGHDQTFTAQPGHAYGAADQGAAAAAYATGYQGAGQGGQYQSGGYSAAEAGQAASSPPPGWHAGAGTGAQPGIRSSDRGGKGFLGSLFDFSFSSFVTPKIIRVLYVLLTIWTALVALIVTIIGFRTGGAAGGIFTLVIIVPIMVLLTLGIYRVVLEAFMVVFRMYEELRQLRENSGAAGPR
jgi:hypothetical protein